MSDKLEITVKFDRVYDPTGLEWKERAAKAALKASRHAAVLEKHMGEDLALIKKLKGVIKDVAEVRRLLSTQTTNSHAVALLDKALKRSEDDVS